MVGKQRGTASQLPEPGSTAGVVAGTAQRYARRVGASSAGRETAAGSVDGPRPLAPEVQLDQEGWQLYWDHYFSGFRFVGTTYTTSPYISVEAAQRAVERREVGLIADVPEYSRARWERQVGAKPTA